jgi:DNA-nicking Smr family endonuclease
VRKRKHPAPPSPDDLSAFHDAVRDVTPLKVPERAPAAQPSPPPPVPIQSLLDIHDAIAESLEGPTSWEQSMETGEELHFIRDGLQRDVLKKLRRGHWVVQEELDLHGLNRAQARLMMAEFLARCGKRGVRCARVIHGKGLGSPQREPVLKGKVRQWLSQRDEVLAFCQAPATQGGGGAVLVLLKGSSAKRSRS